MLWIALAMSVTPFREDHLNSNSFIEIFLRKNYVILTFDAKEFSSIILNHYFLIKGLPPSGVVIEIEEKVDKDQTVSTSLL